MLAALKVLDQHDKQTARLDSSRKLLLVSCKLQVMNADNHIQMISCSLCATNTRTTSSNQHQAYFIPTLGASTVHESICQELPCCFTVQLLHGLFTDVAGLVQIMKQ